MNKKANRRENSSVIINNSKTKQIKNIIINQFICEECYHTNLVMEDKQNKTPKYNEKKTHCAACHKYTVQMCVRDKTITKSLLELGINRTAKEEKAYQLIKTSRNRRS